MRIYMVIDETSFYQQNFIARFLESTKDEVVGAALVTKVLPKSNLNYYLKTHWYYLTITEMFKLAVQAVQAKVFDVVLPKKKFGEFYSVKSVFQFFNIDFINVEYNINQEKYLNHIKSKNPDVIISSNSLYFGKEILGIPKMGCINRHSALLPAYGGLFPVLQAYMHGENKVGVSVHLMNNKIDSGEVISQREIKIKDTDTIADLYKTSFELSTEVVLEALDKIQNNNVSVVKNNYKASYFSFPLPDHWEMFRKRGGKFI